MTIFSGKNYAVYLLASENNENHKSVFSSRIFPRTCRHLPDGGDVSVALHCSIRCAEMVVYYIHSVIVNLERTRFEPAA